MKYSVLLMRPFHLTDGRVSTVLFHCLGQNAYEAVKAARGKAFTFDNLDSTQDAEEYAPLFVCKGHVYDLSKGPS